MKSLKHLLLCLSLLTAAATGCTMFASKRAPELTKLKVPPVEVAASTAAVFDFRYMDTYKGEGARLADITADLLQTGRFAKDVIRIGRFAADADEAVALAAGKSADVAVFGTIDELLYGGLTTSSRAAVTITAVDVQSKTVLWKIGGKMAQPPHEPAERYFYVEHGEDAPLPMNLARKVVEAIVGEMVNRPAAKPAPKVTPSK